MPPKGTNSKKEAGRGKKAENEAKKKEAAAAEKERQESAKWSEGSKSIKAKEAKEEKRLAEAARKAENAKLLAEEEAHLPNKVKSGAGPKAKKPSKPQIPAGPGAIAAGGGLGEDKGKDKRDEEVDRVVESFHATGIDDALELLEVVNAKADKASVGQQAAGLERHPERRFKAAFEAYQERELPQLKQDYPGLRLQQYKDLLYKQFQKSPENPFNQSVVSYDATKAEKLEALRKKQEEVEERLRERMVETE